MLPPVPPACRGAQMHISTGCSSLQTRRVYLDHFRQSVVTQVKMLAKGVSYCLNASNKEPILSPKCGRRGLALGVGDTAGPLFR